MIDMFEVNYYDAPEGWTHIYRLAHLSGTECKLPAETIEFFVKFAKVMLEQHEKLEYASRGNYNDQIRHSAIEQLEILKPVSGRIATNDQSPSEFYQSTCWKHASAVYEKLKNDPLLMEIEAIRQVAEETPKKTPLGKVGAKVSKESIDENTIRRAWRDTIKHPIVGFRFSLFPWIREQEQKKYLADNIAKYSHSKSHFPTLSFNTEIPKSVWKFAQKNDADRSIAIATVTPSDTLKDSEHFLNEDGLQDSHKYFAEVLAQCVIVNDSSYTADAWSNIPTPIVIFIGEQIIAKLERREPRKHWP
jgi:hypothetical protein